MKNLIDFLQALNLNNNREWFNDHRDLYGECRDKVLFITELLINEIRKFDSSIPPTDPGDCLFRIYRDVRFSADKSPYKTHFGSFIARGGRKSRNAGYYLHIEPGGSFLSGGIYMPEPEVLRALRTAIYEQADTFLEIIQAPGFIQYFTSVDGEKLKTNPKGFPPEFEHIDLLRYKSYAFSYEMDISKLTSVEYIHKATDVFKALFPANRFLNEALENYL